MVGSFPRWLMHNNATQYLDISNNNLSGLLPNDIGILLPGVTYLNFSLNSFEGNIPSSIGKMKKLEFLDFSDNHLSGELPKQLAIECNELQYLKLSNNFLKGNIPKFSNWMNMEVLFLNNNNFSGTLEDVLGNNTGLLMLHISNNSISGTIPSSIGMFSNMYVLLMAENLLEGQYDYYGSPIIEISMYNLLINSLAYENSLFIGSDLTLLQPLFDPLIEGLNLEVEFRTKHNDYFYKGKILEKMTGLDLSCNKLTGIIPSQIGDLQQIRALNLSHNYLSGPIPIKFSNLTQIESLDLSYNNLSGKIPSELTQLNFLSIFNVSYNNLSGLPPSTGQFGDFDEENYRGNPGLCGPLLNRKCEGVSSSPSSQSNDNGEKETKVDMTAFYWSFTASYITILLGFITVLCINAHWRMTWFNFIGKLMRTCIPNFPMR
ncbi:hypothetical protein TSUD_263280 [Trifolium subterraneum]|uniref:Leucine-rich repeat-containing N-terminal plant-type domain-containing protein n=1 Tax=Trifolium subterraneum TaxID=3900 RepID=A0A2Z6PPB4_TRISU|nr:hypothetical protein TSUD_263280 [Trifolium subterraneum]